MRKALLLITFTALTLASGAQNFSKSPYSRFGVGEMSFQGFADQQAMGQVSIADRSPLRYSIANPASYSALRMTNFRFGAMGYNGTLQETGQNLAVNNVGFAYLTLGFQVNKKKDWGVVFGATPFSSSGYNIQYDIDSSFGKFTNRFSGNGGLSRYFLGTGKRFGDHLSVGVQASFLMGSIEVSEEMKFPENISYISYKESSTNYLQGFYFEGGAQYDAEQTIRRIKPDSTGRKDTSFRKIKHVIGLTYQSGAHLKGSQDFFARSVAYSSNVAVTKDTILFTNVKGKIQLPASIGFGYSLGQSEGLWRLAVEYKQNFWSDFSSDFNSFKLQNSFQAAAGFSCRFDVDMYKEKNIFKRMEYRVGVRHNSGAINLLGQSIAESGVSFGMGIPLRTRTVNEEFRFENVYSSLDLSFEYYRRGTLSSSLVQENYFRFVLGVSLNDKWFNKRRIE